MNKLLTRAAINIVLLLGVAAIIVWLIGRRGPRENLSLLHDTKSGWSMDVKTFETSPSRQVSHLKIDRTLIPISFRKAYPNLPEVPGDWHAFNRSAKELTVSIQAGAALAFQSIAIKNYSDSVTWIGRNPEIPGAVLIAISNPAGTYDALLSLPGLGEFQVHTALSGETFVSESAGGPLVCGVGYVAGNGSIQASVRADQAIALSVAASSDFTPGTMMTESSSARILASQTSGPFVDLLVLYDRFCLDPEAEFVKPTWRNLDGAPSDMKAYIDGRARLQVEAANVALANSQITAFSWRMVGLEEAPDFVVSGSLNEVLYLNAITAHGSIGDWVLSQVRSYGADQVLFYLGARHGSLPLYVGGIGTAANGFAVSESDARAMIRFDQPYTAAAHELAHNFGAGHDRLTAHAWPADGKHNYGYYWRTDPRSEAVTIPPGAVATRYSDGSVVYAHKDGTKTTIWPQASPGSDTIIGPPRSDGSFDVTTTIYQTAGTIMSYSVFRIPHFSNPDVTVHIDAKLAGASGTPYDWGTQATGVSIESLGAADNARVLSSNATAIIAISPEPVIPAIVTQPVSASYSPGEVFSLGVQANQAGVKYQWSKDGVDIPGATSSTYSAIGSSDTVGSYNVTLSNRVGSVTSTVAEVSLTVEDLLAGNAVSEPSWRTIRHPNGNLYSQVVLTGPSATVRALPGQVTRVSFIDLQDDIVQLEFSGAGALTVVLEDATEPALPTKYNQSVQYAKGLASITIHGADASTYFSAFAVGSLTALNSSLFRSDVAYDGHADLARLTIRSPVGQFGGILLANASFSDRSGITGIDAASVAVGGPVRIHNICAHDSADPVMLFGAVTNPEAGVRIAGGDMAQNNSRPIRVAGFEHIVMSAGTDAHGRAEPTRMNHATYTRDGIDVTAEMVTPER